MTPHILFERAIADALKSQKMDKVTALVHAYKTYVSLHILAINSGAPIPTPDLTDA